ncbi:class C sortase [Ruminococcus sp. JL13D9]|uniref:class C sortase n=1 Tax=Ruminococcus sp. JL13D9 TaxID=3233381 RepID=UPI00389A29A8
MVVDTNDNNSVVAQSAATATQSLNSSFVFKTNKTGTFDPTKLKLTYTNTPDKANAVIKKNVIDSNSIDVSDSKSFTATGATQTITNKQPDSGEVDSEGYVIDGDGNRTSDSPVIFEYDLNALHRDSVAYNKGLINHQGTVDTSDYTKAALKMSDYGLSNFYCYLSIPSIDMYLPVYLGANDDMMSCGAAHLAGTSLPVDMNDTNVALAGHTGYIGRIFFDHIRELDIGDTVTIHNYWETINYKVIDYKVVAPDNPNDIFIKDGRQMLTLITCIKSKGEGFDRYLVICEKK